MRSTKAFAYASTTEAISAALEYWAVTESSQRRPSAGLAPPDAWQEADTDIFSFTAVVFDGPPPAR